MPKQRSVPSYRLHRARNCAVVTVNGRNYYLGAFNTPESREAYARLVAEHFGTGKGNVLPIWTATKSITVTELVASYWDWARGYYVKNGRPSGHLPKVRQALRVLRELYGSTSAASIGPLAMRAIQGHCVAAGMSRVYVNDMCGDIRRVFKWAVSHELLPATSYQALTTVPGLKRGRSAARETDPVLPVDDAVVAASCLAKNTPRFRSATAYLRHLLESALALSVPLSKALSDSPSVLTHARFFSVKRWDRFVDRNGREIAKRLQIQRL